ncbi:UNKNOWN [Stylonychia lemnae]|uniref:Uncharacterized protein n=1 Tax=Stylonychia lemnae TaxID=5949 RepID=A0A077ZQ63_STYLE|nr:UNKNOWN [Stylonychia lemnae]|eukprot:CDW71599.1 UNKNOWN [Stylonychia lemnae]
MQREKGKFTKLHLYKNINRQPTIKENTQSTQPSTPINKSPSKMTDEEKIRYRNKLFQEGDQIGDYLAEQISKCEEVRKEMREQIAENQNLQKEYDKEHETFRQHMEIKIKKYCSKSFAQNQNPVSSNNVQLYMNRSGVRDSTTSRDTSQQDIEVVEYNGDGTRRSRRSSQKVLRMTSKEIRPIKHPYYQRNLQSAAIALANQQPLHIQSHTKSKLRLMNLRENKENHSYIDTKQEGSFQRPVSSDEFLVDAQLYDTARKRNLFTQRNKNNNIMRTINESNLLLKQQQLQNQESQNSQQSVSSTNVKYSTQSQSREPSVQSVQNALIHQHSAFKLRNPSIPSVRLPSTMMLPVPNSVNNIARSAQRPYNLGNRSNYISQMNVQAPNSNVSSNADLKQAQAYMQISKQSFIFTKRHQQQQLIRSRHDSNDDLLCEDLLKKRILSTKNIQNRKLWKI